MNPIANTSYQPPVDLESMKVVNLNPLLPGQPARWGTLRDAPSLNSQRQARARSVTGKGAESAADAANDTDAMPAQAPEATAEVVHFGHACLTRRFEAWLHGSQVLDAPLPARCQDSPEHQAEALASLRRAVREDSYVPSRTPLLFM